MEKDHFHFYHSQNVTEKGKTALQMGNDYLTFVNDIPLSQKTKNTTGANSETTSSEKLLIDGMYLLRNTSTNMTNSLGATRAIDLKQWDVLGRLMKRTTPTGIETFTYDNLNRVVKYAASNGKSETYSYVDQLPLTQTVTSNDLMTTYSYSDIENDTIRVAFDGVPDQYFLNYTTDGVLTRILKNDQVVFPRFELSFLT